MINPVAQNIIVIFYEKFYQTFYLPPQINEWKRRKLVILVLSQIYIFLSSLYASFISCNPHLSSACCAKGEEVHKAHVLVFFEEVLCYPLPVLEFCHELKTLQDFPVQPMWASGFQTEPRHSMSCDSQSCDEEKRICSRLKNSSQGVLMQHCNDGELCHWPRPFEPVYLPLDKGAGFTRFVNGRWLEGIGVKLGDKNRISPVSEWQE